MEDQHVHKMGVFLSFLKSLNACMLNIVLERKFPCFLRLARDQKEKKEEL